MTNRLIIYVVDDGTGLVSCTLWNKKDNNDPDEREHTFQLGDTVHVWGKLQKYQGQKEVSIYNISRIIDIIFVAMLMIYRTSGRCKWRIARLVGPGEHHSKFLYSLWKYMIRYLLFTLSSVTHAHSSTQSRCGRNVIGNQSMKYVNLILYYINVH